MKIDLHSRSFGRLVPVALAIAVSLSPGPVCAQQTEPADLTAAQRDYRKAHEAMREKDWTGARRLLLGLWEKAQTYDVAASLAEVEYELGNYASAAQYMSFALKHVLPNEEASTVERMRAALEQIRTKVGTLSLTVNQPGAEVRVDGKTIGKSPLPGEIFLEPGTHLVEAELGAEASARSVNVVAGQKYTIDLELTTSAPSEVAPPPGESHPPAAGAAVTASVNPKPLDSGAGKSVVPIYAGLGVTAAGLATWIGFGIAAENAKDDADALEHTLRNEFGTSTCSQPTADRKGCKELADTIDRQRRLGTVANVGMGVTLVGAVATLGYILFWPESAAASSGRRVYPSAVVARSGGTVSLVGTF